MIILYGWLALAVVMALLWWRQRATKNATSVDAAWALGLGFLALLYAWRGEGEPARRILVAAVACVWSFRLGIFLLRARVMRESREDGRYRAMREHWGARANFWFFFFYQGQALVAVLFSLPFFFAMQRGGALDLWDWAGAAVGLLAIAGELLADAQLARWRVDHPGRTCRAGLWRYSRHPNYFFEWVHWWAYVLVAAGWWPTLLGPALMLLFLFRLTGIPYTEKQALKSRPDYEDYRKSTSVFFPWFPAKDSR
jgi:steroid 5-alpha reductase family enzyme